MIMDKTRNAAYARAIEASAKLGKPGVYSTPTLTHLLSVREAV
jgi:hypothetical protein